MGNTCQRSPVVDPAATVVDPAAPVADPMWQVAPTDVPLFAWVSKDPVPVRVTDVYDGDTVTLCLAAAVMGPVRAHPTGVVKLKCRLARIDSPEMRSRSAAEVIAATRARDTLRAWVLQQPRVFAVLVGPDKYGRTLVELSTPAHPNVNDDLVRGGWAHPYAGRGPRPTWALTLSDADGGGSSVDSAI